MNQMIYEQFKRSGFQLNFKRVEAGLYETGCGRFVIRKRWKYWEVLDKEKHFPRVAEGVTLKQAKENASLYAWYYLKHIWRAR